MKLIDVVNSPWAIQPEKLKEICAIYSTHLRGDKIDLEGVQSELGIEFDNSVVEPEVTSGIASIDLSGPLMKKANMLSRISGATSTQIALNQFNAAMDDPEISGVVLSIDSPGGTVDGTKELADAVFSRRGEKPIVAFVSGLMASAATWIGTAADAVYISSETAITGSIGVVVTHVDVSEAEKKAGIKTTEIYAGKYKRIASEYAPLSDEGRADMQTKVDKLYSIFVESVARNRGVSVDAVLEKMADARLFVGVEAIEAGLVDGVSTLPAIIDGLVQSGGVPVMATLNSKQNEVNKMDKVELSDITAGFVKEKLPEVFAQIEKDAMATGRDEGAKAERERIQSIEASALPGYEDMISEMKFDGKTTGGEAALKIVAAEKNARKTELANIVSDAPQVVPEVEPEKKQDLSSLPLPERCKAEWDASEDLRSEFATLGAYQAFVEAQSAGLVRIAGK